MVYFVLDPDYNKYMDIQQEINLQLMAVLEERNTRFAFPIRQVEFSGSNQPPLDRAALENEDGEVRREEH